MLITSIYLENFGIVKKFSKQFDKKITVVSGENGQGKSTILNAIRLTVFDDYKGTLEDYINWDADYFKAVICFVHKGIQYESSVYYNGTTDRELKYADKVLKGEEAKRKLKELFDIDLLKAAMLAVEQQIDIVNTKPAERREYLKKIYDIEFKNQIVNLEDECKDYDLELAKKTGIQTEIQHRQYSVPEKIPLPFDKDSYILRQENLNTMRKLLSDTERQADEYQQLKTELDSLQSKKAETESALVKICVDIECFNKDLAGLPDKRQRSLETLETKKTDQIKKNSLALSEIQIRIEELERESNNIHLERLPLFDNDAYTKVSQELYAKKAKLNELQKVTDICPMCGQSINSPEHIEKRKTEINELSQSITALTDTFVQLTQAKKRRETAELNNKQKTDLKKALTSKILVEQERQKTETVSGQAILNSIDSEISHLDESISLEKQHLEELLKTKQEAQHTFNIQSSDITSKIQLITDKIACISLQPTDETRQRIIMLEQELKEYDSIVSRNEEIEKIILAVTEQKKQDESQLESFKDEIQVLNRLIEDTKLSIKILKTEFPVYVISRVVKDIEMSMNDFLRKTYGGRYKIEVKDKKNALHILYGPKKKDVSLASGYEKQVFSSAFRLALCKAMGNKSLVCDEIDSAASEKNSEVLYTTLGELIGQGIDQMICISHKTSTRNLLENDFDAEVLTFEKGIAS